MVPHVSSRKKCIIYSCPTHYCSKCVLDIKTFHRVPRTPTARSLWFNLCQRNDLLEQSSLDRKSFDYFVCCYHFKQSQYQSANSLILNARPRLHCEAAPCINLKKRLCVHAADYAGKLFWLICKLFLIIMQLFYKNIIDSWESQSQTNI